MPRRDRGEQARPIEAFDGGVLPACGPFGRQRLEARHVEDRGGFRAAGDRCDFVQQLRPAFAQPLMPAGALIAPAMFFEHDLWEAVVEPLSRETACNAASKEMFDRK